MLFVPRNGRVAASALVCALGILFAGCSPKVQDQLVATVGNEKITVSDYEKLFIKSNGTRESGAAASQEERERFLGLITKYKLKLADAYRRGLQNDPEVRAEIDQYKGSLAASFLTEREIVEPGTRRFYDRKREEIRASHMLFDTKTGDSAAYAKAKDVIAQLKAGGDFAKLATMYSTDPSAQQNGGDLYYFSAGQMVPPFEDAAYALKAGQITETPIRTSFGLHIIKVVDRIPSRGEIRASHIMIRFPNPTPSPADTATAYSRIVALQDSLRHGVDFASLAMRHSEDPGSSQGGGDLGFFPRRRWPRPFDDTVFTLKVGQVSHIVRTQYGYHLILCTEEHPIKSYDELKAQMQQSYRQYRFDADYAAFLAKVKSETGFQRNEPVLLRLIAAVDSNKTTRDSGWADAVPAALRGQMLIRLNVGSVSVDSAIGMMSHRPDLIGTQLRLQPFTTALEKIEENVVFGAKADLLERTSPEFASIIHDYNDGILLYQIEQDNVWKRIAPNDSLLRIYFGNNREKFVYPDRVSFTSLTLASPADGETIARRLQSGKNFIDVAREDSLQLNRPAHFSVMFGKGASTLSARLRTTLAAVATEMQADTMLRLMVTVRPDTVKRKTQVEKLANGRMTTLQQYLTRTFKIPKRRMSLSFLPRGTSAMSDSLVRATAVMNDRVDMDLVGRRNLVVGRPDTVLTPRDADERALRADSLQVGAYSSPFPFKGRTTIVHLVGREGARQKTYEEASPEVSTAYQDYESKRLENEWIDGLRKQFPVTEHKELLKEAFAPAH
jgi:peptidyl-prolyl cis-trans isomerase SurA